MDTEGTLVRHEGGCPRQVEEKDSSASWKRSRAIGLVRRLLPLEVVFKAGRLAFTYQLSQRPGMRKGKAGGRRVTKALRGCWGGP